MTLVIIPGYGDSGPQHWQTAWQHAHRDSVRFEPSSWDAPRLDDWLAALDRAVAKADSPLLVAHSLGCLLVAHWASRGGSARGAFLVAPPDPAASVFPREAASFSAVPRAPLPFPSMLVASADDPYATVEHVAQRAEEWGSELVVIGPYGHINASSGIGDWPQGRTLFERFRATLV